jgi:hypothetical protein
MAEPLRHRQTKGAETDMFYLTPPRHISTLPIATVSRCPRYVRFSSDSDQIADVPDTPYKVRSGRSRDPACEPQVYPAPNSGHGHRAPEHLWLLRTQANLGGPSRFTHFNFKVFRGHAIIDRGHANASFTPLYRRHGRVAVAPSDCSRRSPSGARFRRRSGVPSTLIQRSAHAVAS